MRWVSRKVLKQVMPNPYNQSELIKSGKANEIFSDIQKLYLDQYANTWNRTLIPLEFFAKEYSKRSGQPVQVIQDLFEKHFLKEERKLYETSQ